MKQFAKKAYIIGTLLGLCMVLASIILICMKVPRAWLCFFISPIVFLFFAYKLGGLIQEEDKRKEAEKVERAKVEGKIYCSSDKLKYLFQHFNSLDYMGIDDFNCPVCHQKLMVDYNYVTSAYIKDKKMLDGVYVASTISGQAKQAWEWVNERREFSAKCITCPSCEYRLYKSMIGTYEDVTRFERDEDGGGYETRTEYCQHVKLAFMPGKITEEVVENLKKDKSFSCKLVDESEFLKK